MICYSLLFTVLRVYQLWPLHSWETCKCEKDPYAFQTLSRMDSRDSMWIAVSPFRRRSRCIWRVGWSRSSLPSSWATHHNGCRTFPRFPPSWCAWPEEENNTWENEESFTRSVSVKLLNPKTAFKSRIIFMKEIKTRHVRSNIIQQYYTLYSKMMTAEPNQWTENAKLMR